MSPRRSQIMLACITVFVASCDNDRGRSVDETETSLLIAGEAPDSAESQVVAGLQLDFLRRIVDPESDPSALMSTEFTMRDAADTSEVIRRGPGGAPGFGLDYLRALSERVPREYSAIASMQIVNERPNHAVVITRHPAVSPSVTRWDRLNGEWKAVSFVINVSEGALANLIATGPRS